LTGENASYLIDKSPLDPIQFIQIPQPHSGDVQIEYRISRDDQHNQNRQSGEQDSENQPAS
jgi:hypothetical protein